MCSERPAMGTHAGQTPSCARPRGEAGGKRGWTRAQRLPELGSGAQAVLGPLGEAVGLGRPGKG